MNPSTPVRTPPVPALYAGGAARALAAALRALDAVAPSLGTRAALRLFFTPLPWKLAGRRPVPPPWTVTRWPFESVSLAAYRRVDVAPGRPTVLLVHGWAGGAMQLRALGDTLADAGFDPVLLDFPGHGRGGGWRSSLPQFARALHAAASRLGPLHAIVAHSLGALAALHAAAGGIAAQRLVLLAPPAPPAQFLRWFAGTLRLADSVPHRMRERIEAAEGVSLQQFEPDWLGPRVAQPTLIVHDQGDRVSPLAASQRLVQALRRGELSTTDGLGHNRVLADAAVAATVLRHLR